jgi:hypothetical protein
MCRTPVHSWGLLSATGCRQVQVWYPDARNSCSQKETSVTVVSRQRIPGDCHIKVLMLEQAEYDRRHFGSPICHTCDVYYLHWALETMVCLCPIVLNRRF